MGRIEKVDTQSLKDKVQRESWDRLLQIRKSSPPPANLYTTLLHSPKVMLAWAALVLALFGIDENGDTKGDEYCVLPARLRKLVILQAAHVTHDQYEWHNHSRTASVAGVSQQEVTAIGNGQFGEFDRPEKAALAFVGAALERRTNDALFEELKACYGRREIVEITVLAGFYACVTTFAQALAIDKEA